MSCEKKRPDPPQERAVASRVQDNNPQVGPLGVGGNAGPLPDLPQTPSHTSKKVWLTEGVVEDIVPVKTDYPYFVWDDTKSC